MSQRNSEKSRRSLWMSARVAVLFTTIAVLACSFEVALRMLVPASKLYSEEIEDFWKAQWLERRAPKSDDAGANRSVDHHPVLGWWPRALLDWDEVGVHTNSRRFRGTREYADRAPQGMRRSVFLGDSFTYGFGVRDEEVYVEQLAQLLPTWEHLNLGVNGYGTDQTLLYWREVGRDLAPDWVILAYYLPDFDRNTLTFRDAPKPRFRIMDDALALENIPVPSEAELRQRLPVPAPLPSIRTLAAMERVCERLFWDPLNERFEEKTALTQGIVRALQEETRATGSRLAMMLIPEERLTRDERWRAVSRVVIQTAADHSIPLLDLTPILREETERTGISLYGDNLHWTPAGHRIAADALAKFWARLQRSSGPSSSPDGFSTEVSESPSGSRGS